MKRHIYFDNAATTFIDSEVFADMKPFLTDYFGNPSSIYQYSSYPVQGISDARKKVADSIGADAGEVYFTSGGSELITGQYWEALLPTRILVSILLLQL
jgi:cysteine desulfurase